VALKTTVVGAAAGTALDRPGSRPAPSTEGEKESAAFAELVRLISAEARQTPSPTGFFGTGRRRQPPRAGSAAKLNPSRE